MFFFYFWLNQLSYKHYRKYLKDILKEHKNVFFYIGLKFNGGNVLTYDDKVLGESDDFEGNNFMDNDNSAVMVSNYKLNNLSGTSRQPFICQHN